MKPAMFLFLMVFMTLASPVRAEDVPLPSAHPVKEVENKMSASKAREKALEKEMKGLRQEVAKTRESLVQLAAGIRKKEDTLQSIEREITVLEGQKAAIESRLGADRGAAASFILALRRVERMPTESLIVRPGAPLETARSAMLLQSVLPPLRQRADALKADMGRLDGVIRDLQVKRENAKVASDELESRRKEINILLSRREQLFARSEKDYRKQEETLKALSLKARTLKDLITRIERMPVEEEEPQVRPKKRERAEVRPARFSLPGRKDSRLPVSGSILTGYGEDDALGAPSQGITISGRSGAIVTTPLKGVVRYAGTFRNYGRLVIVEHEKGRHSLIAGLGKIDTVVGQSVSAGEPVGVLGPARNDAPPSLYFELRQDGRAVDPSRFL